MASFFESVSSAVKGAYCTLLGGPNAVPYLAGGNNNATDFIARQVNAARRWVCNSADEITDQDVGTSPGFTGGQCPGVTYSVSFFTTNFRTQRCDNGQTQNNPGPQNRGPVQVVGPIQSITRRTRAGGCQGGIRGYQWVAVDGNGQEVSLGIVETGFPAELFAIGIDGPTFSISRADGSPDNCGDPNPTIDPYVPTPVVINIEYEDNTQTTINEDIDITIFAPVAIVAGNIIAPITVSGNTFQLAGTVEVSPNFEVNLSPEFNINRAGNTDEDPPDGVDQPPLPEPENERRVIVGAIVTATGIGTTRSDSIPQAGNPDIWIPRLGSLSFYVATDKGTAWTSDIDIKNTRCYIPCPVPSGAVDVAATGVSGISLDVEPVWAYPLQSPI